MTNRTDTERHRRQVTAANRARTKAVKALIEENRERFDDLYAQECAVEGVTPRGPNCRTSRSMEVAS